MTDFAALINSDEKEANYVREKESDQATKIYESKAIIDSIAKKQCIGPLDKRAINKKKRKMESKSTLKGWFNMPKVAMTDEIKNTIKEINLRGNMEKDKFFKKGAKIKQTDYIQIGTVVNESKKKKITS